MKTIFWIPTLRGPQRLAIVARPRGWDWLDGDLGAFRREGINHLVSLLEQGEEEQLGLIREPESCKEAGLVFHSLPVADRSVPVDASAAHALAYRLACAAAAGEPVGIHCRQSVGRSSVLGALVLLSLGATLAEAIASIAEARGVSVPETEDQAMWLSANAHLARPA